MKPVLVILSCVLLFSFNTIREKKSIPIDWTDELNSDFAFTENWSYPEGVYTNAFGQLSCDGLCPEGTEQMKDENGKIFNDSLQAFYGLVDTTHRTYSLHAEAWTYEWAGSNFMSFKQLPDNSILGQSECTTATHSSLQIKITNNSVNAWIEYNSIVGSTQLEIFPLKSGEIKIDPVAFDQGIVKAEFDFIFDNTLNPEKKMFWKGLIYSQIK